MLRSLGFLIVLLAASTALATGKPPKPPKTPPAKPSANAQAGAAAYSASASKSSSSAKQRQQQGQGQSQTALGTVNTDSHDRYEAEEIPVNTAAELPSGFCSGNGMSVQTSYVGISNVDRDYICARLELYRALLDAELGVGRVLAAVEVEKAAKPSLKGAAVAEETLRELAASVHADALRQLRLADERLGEDDTIVRKFFVRTLGSLPILSIVAPR